MEPKKNQKYTSYSEDEKVAYYLGVGLGYCNHGPVGDKFSNAVYEKLTKAEFDSYINGLEVGSKKRSEKDDLAFSKRWSPYWEAEEKAKRLKRR